MRIPSRIRRRNGAVIAVSLALAGLLTANRRACHRQSPPEAPVREAPTPRIVSLAPATTESLFALGLGGHVIGVSRFCDFPPAVTNLPRVGGLTDVDIEAIVRLRPDVVVAPRPQLRARETLVKLGIDVLTVDQDTLPQILDSMWILGEALGRADVATAWMTAMESVMAKAKQGALTGAARPRVLVSVGRDTTSFERIYIAGNGNFYSEILEAVGGRNAYEGDAPYPMVGGEGIVRMNPDIIIDIVPEFSTGARLAADRALAQWKTLPGVKAIEANRVHIVTEPWAVRPGPRVGFLVERFAQIVQRRRESADTP